MEDSVSNLGKYPLITKEPFFSVVIPTFNRSQTVLRALNSLIAQTETDWEAIIIDDGSTDNTFDLLIPIIENHPQIKYIFQSNKGAAKAKNTGIFVASGKFITFLDSDDEFHLEHLEIRKKLLLENPELDFIYGGVSVIGNQWMPHKDGSNRTLKVTECIIGGTFVMRREALLRLEGFRNIKLSEDSDLFDRAVKENLRILKVEAPTYLYYRESLKSLTHEFAQSLG
ncbi:glycosyltransferase family 2 protein [Fulvivirgaceae bacterium LMO-SS25]